MSKPLLNLTPEPLDYAALVDKLAHYMVVAAERPPKKQEPNVKPS